jgi:hypothetical protein
VQAPNYHDPGDVLESLEFDNNNIKTPETAKPELLRPVLQALHSHDISMTMVMIKSEYLNLSGPVLVS